MGKSRYCVYMDDAKFKIQYLWRIEMIVRYIYTSLGRIDVKKSIERLVRAYIFASDNKRQGGGKEVMSLFNSLHAEGFPPCLFLNQRKKSA